ncbi:MAG: hypothetical protein H0T84_00230 [Tatlockia sp.]|nr:hypothetical protein [Tatlockia sp.]
MPRYEFWSKDAVDYATMPTRLAYYLFFDNYPSDENCLKTGSRSIVGGAFILLSLPVDLLVGLFTLPVAIFHDLFAFIGNCFDDLINNRSHPSSFKNSYLYLGTKIALLPSLATGATILNSFGIDSGCFDGGYDPMWGVAMIPIFILSLPLSLLLTILALPVAATADFFKLVGNCFDSAEVQHSSFSC